MVLAEEPLDGIKIWVEEERWSFRVKFMVGLEKKEQETVVTVVMAVLLHISLHPFM